MEPILVCPFTSQPLRALDATELQNFHERIQKGGLFFHKGVPLEFLPQKAYVSRNSVFIYVEIDGVVLLKKETAIVGKNHTENPLKRTTQLVIDAFYRSLDLSPEGEFIHTHAAEPTSLDLNEATNKSLKSILPKSGGCLVTMGTNQLDALHNLLFGLEFREHCHLDHDIARLRQIAGNLKANTQYVLIDKKSLPLSKNSVDGLLSFSFNTDSSKEEQVALYDSLKVTLKTDAKAIILSEGGVTSPMESRHKSDVLSTKAKSLLTPWKKAKAAEIVFHHLEASTGSQSDAFSGKRSLGSQFS